MTKLSYLNFSIVSGKRHILEPITMELKGPGVVALLGPSGVGKTSLLRATQNLSSHNQEEWTHQGDILFNDVSVFKIRNIAQKIGFIQQKPRMLAGSVMDNVTFALKYTTRFSKQEILRKAETVLEQVGLTEELNSLDTPAWCLSGGQAQRLAVARSIAMEPAVLLMDEPCSALDPVKSGKMEHLIERIAADRLVVLVTHNTRLAQRIAGQVAFMMPGDEGAHLMALGPTDQIFEHPPNPVVCEFIRFGTHGNCHLTHTRPMGQAKRLFLFVCGGNTSRSPMAQAICNQEVARALGMTHLDLSHLGIEAISAGLEIEPDRPLSGLAQKALQDIGYDPHEHRTQMISLDMVQRAAAIFCMTRAQCRTLIERFPDYGYKVRPLDFFEDIANPHGAEFKVYQEVAGRIRDAVRWQLNQLSRAGSGL